MVPCSYKSIGIEWVLSVSDFVSLHRLNLIQVRFSISRMEYAEVKCDILFTLNLRVSPHKPLTTEITVSPVNIPTTFLWH